MEQHSSFTNVTEQPGHRATKYQMSAMMTRYDFASKLSENADVLEVACGSGTGLGLIARTAKSVTGGDIDPLLVKIASDNHSDNPKIKVLQLEAQKMPFADHSFDIIFLFEALYYIADVDRFMKETQRVLKPNGRLCIVNVNCEWHGFNASPFSIKYYSTQEFVNLFSHYGFTSKVNLAYHDLPGGFTSGVVALIRKIAIALRLIPDTMEGKEKFKRLFYGKLEFIPPKIYEGWATVENLIDYDIQMNLTNYKVIYITGFKKS